MSQEPAQLITTANIDDADRLYEELIAAHDGLTAEQSHALNVKLVLILANHVGSCSILRQAIDAAKK